MLEHTDKHPSGSALSAAGHRFGTLELRELLAARGDAGLWLAEDGDGARSLLRLYPGLPTAQEWHALELATSWRWYAEDPRLVPIKEVALDVWPRVSFACSDAEPLARRIARAPMAPDAVVAMCADVAGALAVLQRVGVGPVDVGPADIVFVGEQAQLLADAGLPGGQLAHACVDLDHLAPERAAAIADRARGVPAERRDGAYPTAQSMTYALASIVSAALGGPQSELHAALEQVLRRGLAERPSERYASPSELAGALGDAIGVPVERSDTRVRRAPRPRGAEPLADVRERVRAAVARRDLRPDRRRAGAPARRGTQLDRRRRAGVAIPAAVVLVAAAIGLAAGSATTPSDPPAPLALAGAGITVEAPHGWLRAGPGAAPPALGGAAVVARSPAHPAGSSSATTLVITRTTAPLLSRLADAVPEPVRLGAGHDAWRYRDVALDAGRAADVYVLEDGRGRLVAACVAPAGAPASLREPCAAALTTLQLAGPVVPLGGGAAARSELARVVADLDRARGQARGALAAARTGRRQAAAADRLSAAYARAAEAAGRIATVGAPGDLPRLAGQLGETGRAYAALAAAARGTHRTAYARARDRVVAQERALEQDLAALSAASPSR